ncbi:phasin family protein [Parasulfitobacter algicola]|uniref:Phasin family protein n=1 Tax=Parasulfitobacter algicola TaxID=2614809 RepID=A0ABX2IT70_9RHOB|nr:phasin family protein [Sulfitobacter algicola]NSX53466.1 phasin family protein [Sulfitobacter algicola]
MPKTSKSADTKSSGPEDIMSAMADFQKMGFGSLSWMGTGWLENMGDFNSEIISFIAERVQEDVKTQHEILHCKDMDELRHIQAQFIQTAINQYTEQTGKMVELSNELLTTVAKKD